MKYSIRVLLSAGIALSALLCTMPVQAGFWGNIVSGITGSK